MCRGDFGMPSCFNQLKIIGLILGFSLLAACATGPTIVVNSDPSADWTAYRTFGFFPQLSTDRGQVRSIISNQLIESTRREMEAAGFTFTETNPDLLIDFVISTQTTLQTRPSSSASFHHSRGRYSTWSGWSYSMSTTEVVQRLDGTLAVDIVDRARNQLVWEGAASKRITSRTLDNQSEVLDSAIADIFLKFP